MFLIHFDGKAFQQIFQRARGPFGHLRQRLLGSERLFPESGIAGQQSDNFPVLLLLLELVENRLDPHRLADLIEKPLPGNRLGGPVSRQQPDPIHTAVQHMVFHGFLVVDIELLLSVADLEERRLGDVEMAPLDDLLHLTEEKGEQQRSDVQPVHVRVGHDDDLVVAESADVLVLLADAGAERGNDHLEFLVLDHFVEACLLDIENLSPERQDCLVPPVPSLFGGAAGGVALHQIEFAASRIPLLAVGKFSGQGAHLEGGLAPGQLPRPSGRFPRPGGIQTFAQQLFCNGGILLEIGTDLIVDDSLDEPLDLAVAELGLGLTFELRVADLDTDHTGQPFAEILALQGLFPVFQQVAAGCIIVESPRQG